MMVESSFRESFLTGYMIKLNHLCKTWTDGFSFMQNMD